MEKLQVLALCFWLLCLTYLMTSVEESVDFSDTGPQTQIHTYDHKELCDHGVGFTLAPGITLFTLTLSHAVKLASQYIAFSFWLLRHGSFIWVKVTIVIFHFKLCLLITLLEKTKSDYLKAHHHDTRSRFSISLCASEDTHIDRTDVERRSKYKSIIALSSGYPPNTGGIPLTELRLRLKHIAVGYPTIPNCKLSSLLPLVARKPHKSKYLKEVLFTAQNSNARSTTVPIYMLSRTLSGVLNWWNQDVNCCAYVYYKEKPRKTDIWIVNFVIAPDDPKCAQAVKEKFSSRDGHFEALSGIAVKFETDKVVLKIRQKSKYIHGYVTDDIPLEGMDLHCGCGSITPLTGLGILKKQVNRFGSGQGTMPRCQFQVKWKEGDKLELKQMFILEGAKRPNIFNLVLHYEANKEQSEEYSAYVFKKKLAADHWRLSVVIVQDDPKCEEAVKHKFSDHYDEVVSFPIKFEQNGIDLKIRKRGKIPMGGLDLDGWNITPLTYSPVLKEQVNRFVRGNGAIPRCKFEVKWNSGESELKEAFILEGAKRPNIFNLVLHYEESKEQSEVYSAYVFKKLLAADHWIMSVAISRDDPKCEEAVKNKFSDHEEVISPFPVKFEQNEVDLKIRKKDKTCLEIPPEGLDLDGWNITPDTYPQITKEHVKRFLSGSLHVPCCQLQVKCLIMNGRDRVELKKVVTLEGVKKPSNVFVFNLTCSHEGPALPPSGSGDAAVQLSPQSASIPLTSAQGISQPPPQAAPIPLAGAEDWSQESHPSSGQIHVGSGQLPPQAASALVVGAQERVPTDFMDKKPQVHELREVIKTTQSIWEELAYALYFDRCEVAAIGRNNHTVMEKCRAMLGKWLDGTGKRKPRTWRILLEALREIDHTELAKEVVSTLSNR